MILLYRRECGDSTGMEVTYEWIRRNFIVLSNVIVLKTRTSKFLCYYFRISKICYRRKYKNLFIDSK